MEERNKALSNKIEAVVSELFDIKIEVSTEKPRDATHGDISTNVAMQLAGKLKRNPFDIANEIVDKLGNLDGVSELSVARPGFINFLFDNKYLKEELKSLVESNFESLGKTNLNKGEKVIVEFTDPNPFKEFHIGHLYSNVVGESIARLYEATGAEVKRADYFGDVGMHVAKSIWGLIHKLREDGITLKDLENRVLTDKMKYLGESYAKGATAYKDNDALKIEMQGINKQISIIGQKFYKDRYKEESSVDFTSIEAEEKYQFEFIEELYLAGREWSLEYFDSIYERVGMKFDLYYPESVTGELGYATVKKGLKEGIFDKSGDAVVLDAAKSKLHTRVFINSLGIPTYEAKELGLAPAKYKDFQYTKSIIITGNEIDEYFKVLLKAMEMTLPDLASKTIHMSHGMVRLPDGKMSSRTGKIIRGTWLLDEVKSMLDKHYVNEEGIDSEAIAQAAVKYTFLVHSIGGDIAFDFDKSLSFEGRSGPYLQYTYSRILSLLEKTEFRYGDQDYTNAVLDKFIDGIGGDENELVKKIASLNEVINEASLKNAPHLLALFLFELAQTYNSFYSHNQISTEKNEEKKYFWQLLSKITSEVINRGLYLLGIQTVEKM